MINLALSIFAASIVFFLVSIPLGVGGAIVPAIIALIAGHVLLGRRISRRVDAVMREIEKHVMAGRVDRGIALLESLRPLGRWQFLLGAVIDSQVGVLRYAHKQDPEGARPYLERALVKHPLAQAMLGAYHYRRKQYDDVVRVLERATKKNKKTSLLWSMYAWCEWKQGRRQKAIEILVRARRHLPNDAQVQRNLLALSNSEKMKMKAYGAEWWVLGLEKPPVQKIAPRHQRHPAWSRAPG
ncbi:MAG: tetratricopeptide repeat protein [Deltaproteobacteria bacterium]|nr:tetratricopeptide repeat protein [Deltaproteobacteria bacterium]